MRVGGIPEVIEDGVSGLLMPFGDVDAFSRAVAELLRDAAKRQSLGANARTRARKLFSADVIVPKYEELYRRVMGETFSRKKTDL